MVRASILIAFICALVMVEARWTQRPTKTTTTQKPLVLQEDDRKYHPAGVQKPRLIEQYDQRAIDGHYEYRYVLSNGDTRYERAYWLPVGRSMVLARKGYYSYPLKNGSQFMTVIYDVDHNGYHVVSSKITKKQPTLPRSLDVPEHEAPERTTTKRPLRPKPAKTTQRPITSTTTRRTTMTTKSKPAQWHFQITAQQKNANLQIPHEVVSMVEEEIAKLGRKLDAQTVSEDVAIAGNLDGQQQQEQAQGQQHGQAQEQHNEQAQGQQQEQAQEQQHE